MDGEEERMINLAQFQAHLLSLGKVAKSKSWSRDKKIEPRPGTEGLTSLSLAGSSATFSLKGQKALAMYRSAATSVELVRRSMAETPLEADWPFESAPLETLKSTIDKNLKESLLLA
jgi:hypothetical protein